MWMRAFDLPSKRYRFKYMYIVHICMYVSVWIVNLVISAQCKLEDKEEKLSNKKKKTKRSCQMRNKKFPLEGTKTELNFIK